MSSPVRLVQFTDPHLFGTPSGELRGVNTYQSLLATLDHARRSHWPVDAVLVTGDLVQDDASGYPVFHQIFSSLQRPVYCIPGNHDDGAAMAQALADPPFQIGGHADLGAWRIVLLDSCIPGSARGRLNEQSLDSLASALASAAGAHVLVCLHHHPVAMNSRWLDTVGLENARDFWRIIDGCDAVRAVLWGHVHQSFEGKRGKVRLLATPSTCSQFVPHAADFEIDALPPAYRTLTLSEDGSLATEVVWVRRAGNRIPSAA